MTPDRRSFLTNAGLAALAVGTGTLTGCGGRTSPGSPPAVGAALSIPVDSIPVGGGRILDNANYVITQPTEGEFRAFNKMCTHQGCPVSSVEDGEIHCRCHGARFSIEDGAVTNPPATEPLRAASATLNGDHVDIAD
ncbi:Rieske (2Fe-2S) protein [Propioniciclava soli]|uniref:Rieske (2Fe-2S) protein n=1 Tax=Propioniciclava soli TaxID=2775081 RepID=A0ABZ3C4A4_9ACTN|nr:Rieske (2Fe-2S) protein [Propioniciclava soli]